MNKSPAFQFYPEKWVAHTMHLSAEAYQLYHRMLCWMWMNSPDRCSMGKDPKMISMAIYGSPARDSSPGLAEIQNPYNPLLIEENEKYISHGLQKEVESQNHFHELSKQGNNSRWKDKLHLIPARTPARDTKKCPSEESSPSPSPSINKPPYPPSGERVCVPKKTRPPNQQMSKADSENFAKFYDAYPLHKARGAAEKWWASHKPNSELTEIIAQSATRYAESDQVRRGFAKHPATWLNAKCWQDEDDLEPKHRNSTNPDKHDTSNDTCIIRCPVCGDRWDKNEEGPACRRCAGAKFIS